MSSRFCCLTASCGAACRAQIIVVSIRGAAVAVDLIVVVGVCDAAGVIAVHDTGAIGLVADHTRGIIAVPDGAGVEAVFHSVGIVADHAADRIAGVVVALFDVALIEAKLYVEPVAVADDAAAVVVGVYVAPVHAVGYDARGAAPVLAADDAAAMAACRYIAEVEAARESACGAVAGITDHTAGAGAAGRDRPVVDTVGHPLLVILRVTADAACVGARG